MTPTSSGRISSRLARHEQRKMIRQTVILIAVAIVLVVAFLFVILPQSIRLITGLTGSGTILSPEDTLPPQVPVLAAPPAATPSGSIKVTGFGEAQSELVVLLNGAEYGRQAIPDDGNFEVDIELQDGSNDISAYAIDASENESATSQSYTVIRDSEAPKLEIQEPQDGQQIELRRNQTLTIKGTSDPNVRITINGRLVFARSDGTFTTTYQLQEGENKLQIVAQDEAGNTTQQELTVNFRL